MKIWNKPTSKVRHFSKIDKIFITALGLVTQNGEKSRIPMPRKARHCRTGYLDWEHIILCNQSHYIKVSKYRKQTLKFAFDIYWPLEVAQGGVSSRAIHNWLWIFSLFVAKKNSKKKNCKRDITQHFSADATMIFKKSLLWFFFMIFFFNYFGKK